MGDYKKVRVFVRGSGAKTLFPLKETRFFTENSSQQLGVFETEQRINSAITLRPNSVFVTFADAEAERMWQTFREPQTLEQFRSRWESQGYDVQVDTDSALNLVYSVWERGEVV